MDAAAHVTGLVRSADRDRYLATLYAPQDRRGSLFALYAFNAEIAVIRERIREPLAGEVRLQWWKDAVHRPTGDLTGNPVADQLRAAIVQHRLPTRVFADMLEARMFDLYDDPMPDRATLEGYCGETASALIQLAALVLDADAAPAAADAAGHAGCAQAMTGLLRLMPLHRARGQCYVPADLLTAAGTSREEFVSAAPGEGADRAIAAMTSLAAEHQSKFETAARELPQPLWPAFLPAALTPAYLAGLNRRRADPLRELTDISAFSRHSALFRHARRGWR